jgi:hypothetical protein
MFSATLDYLPGTQILLQGRTKLRTIISKTVPLFPL